MNRIAIRRTIVVMAMAGAVTLLLALAYSPPARAAFPGSNGKIVFDATPGSAADVYTISQYGYGMKNLTNSQTQVQGGANWSADGTKIVYDSYNLSADTNVHQDIWVMNADGTGKKDLTNNGYFEGDPAWSPDGKQIAYISNQDGTNAIWVMNSDGTNQHILNATPNTSGGWDNGCWSGHPRWSPDGTKIVFDQENGCKNSPDNHHILVVNADGSGTPSDLTPTSGDDNTLPDWSPDGKKIAFTVRINPSGPQTIDTISATGGTPKQIADDNGLTGATPYHPAWSPDGTEIAFAFYNGSGKYEVLTRSADGTGPFTVVATFNAPVGSPDWQPLGVAPQTPSSPTISSRSKSKFSNTSIGAKRTKTFKVTNTGGGKLSITGLRFTGADRRDFRAHLDTCSKSVASGSSCKLKIVFAPRVKGTLTAILKIKSNDSADSPRYVTFTGKGVHSMVAVRTRLCRMVVVPDNDGDENTANEEITTVKQCVTRRTSKVAWFKLGRYTTARLLRHGHAYAVGFVARRHHHRVATLNDRRSVPKGKYVLVIHTMLGSKLVAERIHITLH